MDTLYEWQKAVREGRLEAGPGSRPTGDAMSLAEELAVLRKQNKAYAKLRYDHGNCRLLRDRTISPQSPLYQRHQNAKKRGPPTPPMNPTKPKNP